MEISGGREGAAERTLSAGVAADRNLSAGVTADRNLAATVGADRNLAAGVAARLERMIGLFRSLSPPSGLSLTAAATLATLERSGPCRLTSLSVQEGVTQPAMTQLIGRLEESGLVRRAGDPDDGRVVQVSLTDEGRAMLAKRRAVRAERLAEILDRLSPQEQAALGAALPAMDALANAQSPATSPYRGATQYA